MRGTLIAILVVSTGCEARLTVGAGCTSSSECSAPLVCRDDRCRSECRVQRDCPLGALCLLHDDGTGTCALPDDPDCMGMDALCPEDLLCVGRDCVNPCASVAECPAGSRCESGTGADRRAHCVREDVDAGPPPGDGGADPCAPEVVQSAVRLLGADFADHVALATSETADGTGEVGWAHVGAVGTLPAGTEATAIVLTVPLTDLDAVPVTTDLSGEPFYLHAARSLGLGARPDGDVGVLALFDGSGATPPAQIRGATGTLAAGGSGIVSYGGWICSESVDATCVPAPAVTLTNFGRALVVGAADGPLRYLYRYGAGGPEWLASTADDGSGDHQTMTMLGGAPFVDLAGTTGSVVATLDPAISGGILLWDGSTDGAPVAAMPVAASSRPALARVGPAAYVLGIVTTDAIELYEVDCRGRCAVTPSPVGAFRTEALAPRLPVATSTSGSFDVVVVRRGTFGAGPVHDEAWLDRWVGPGLEATGVTPLFRAEPGRNVVDVQLASATDHGSRYYVAALLVGPDGASTGDEVWIAAARVPSSCP